MYRTEPKIEVPKYTAAGDTVPVKVVVKYNSLLTLGLTTLRGRVRCYWQYHPFAGEDSYTVFTKEFTLSPWTGYSDPRELLGSFTMPNSNVTVWAQVDIYEDGRWVGDNYDTRAVTEGLNNGGGGGGGGNLVGDLTEVQVPSTLAVGAKIDLIFDAEVTNNGWVPAIGRWLGKVIAKGNGYTAEKSFSGTGTVVGFDTFSLPTWYLGRMPDESVDITVELWGQDYWGNIITPTWHKLLTKNYTIEPLGGGGGGGGGGGTTPPPTPPGYDYDMEELLKYTKYAAIGIGAFAALSLLLSMFDTRRPPRDE